MQFFITEERTNDPWNKLAVPNLVNRAVAGVRATAEGVGPKVAEGVGPIF